MKKAKKNKIRHIMKRIAEATRLFNSEVDALNVELSELLTEEE